ncbi:NAD(P)-binding protein [Halobacillus litoralis]|uniref:NAD(P)-binding protein n=1 Tax=Halobacillus litoralis TaxID=45668 RepID=A0A845FDC3_9BACI|nr:FAD-dependent oxidoreductase [Halobacillus litoralis]MYL71575.1 NAD(P)-binding protein [Halobacillus litoralis]
MRYESVLQYPFDMLSIIRNGLPIGGKSNKKKIIIIGAGMSGLVAGSLLKQADHHVTILEANNRVGGRVYTIRSPFFAPGNYFDVGAMRIPSNHKLAMEYIHKFRLPVNPFFNTNPNDLIYANNVLTTRKYYELNPDVLEYPLKQSERGKTAQELFLEATQPFRDLYYGSPPQEQEKLRDRFSQYSMREFLKFNPYGISLSDGAIRKIAVLLGIEGFPEYSFIDILTDIAFPIFSQEIDFVEITGGNDRLPWSFYPGLKSNICFNQQVERIYNTKGGIRVQTKNTLTNQICVFEGNYSVITIPFPLIQFVDIYPYDSISFDKYQIIRELNSINAVKIGIEFKNRFWERIGVGNAVTDQPTRYSYIPSHGRGTPGPAVLLASYTWGHDSELWTSLSLEGKVKEALTDLAKIYGNVVYKEYLTTVAYDWALNPFSAGAFTLFLPGQGENFSAVMKKTEGRLHFAGEGPSDFHGWIEGAIESGIRAAHEVNKRD